MGHNYIIAEADASMKLRRFEWTIDGRNNAVLTWEWPQNRLVKLMFVFAWEHEEIPDIKVLLEENYPHEVVTRELAAKFSQNIPGGKRKFIAAPAYFNDDKGITICKPVYVSGWLFRKAAVNAAVAVKPLPLSTFAKVKLRVASSDPAQMPLVSQVLRYAVYEQGRKIGEYPLDALSMSGACGFYIKKGQQVKFILDENYSHLLDLRG